MLFRSLGTDRLLKAMIKSPEKVHELLRYITYNVKYVVDTFTKLDVGFSMADPIASGTMLTQNYLKKVLFSSKMKKIIYIGERHCLQYQMYHCVSVTENCLMKSTSNLQKEILMD